jgi:hypothetical protein
MPAPNDYSVCQTCTTPILWSWSTHRWVHATFDFERAAGHEAEPHAVRASRLCPICGRRKSPGWERCAACQFNIDEGLPPRKPPRSPSPKEQDRIQEAQDDEYQRHLGDLEYQRYLEDPQSAHHGWNHDGCAWCDIEVLRGKEAAFDERPA